VKYLIAILLFTSCATKQVIQPINTNTQVDVFSYRSNLPWVKNLSDASNCTINLSQFQDALSRIESFDMSEDNGKQVLENLLDTRVAITTYKSKNPFSKAIATTYANDKTSIYLNTRRNPRAMKDMVNTSLHESLHIAGYSHGDNSSIGKENTVNYKVGEIAGEHYEKYCK